MPLDDNEAWLHPIKAISVKRDTLGVPRPEGVYDSGHEPSDEDELHDYQARYGSLGDPQRDIGQSSSHPPPPPSQQPRRQLPPVLHPILRTRCSHSLSASTHSGMRPRSTKSSLHRIWRLCVLICRRSLLIRPSFFSSSSRCRHRSPSSWLSTSPHHHHRSDHQGSPLHLYCLFLASGDTGYLVWGGGGGGGCGDRVFVLFSYVLILVECSVFILLRILVLFRVNFSLLLPCILMSHVLVCLWVY